MKNATSFSAGAASGIITQKAITEATKFAKKALFPKLTPEHVLARIFHKKHR